MPETPLEWVIWNLEVDVRQWEARIGRGYWDFPSGRVPLTEDEVSFGQYRIRTLNREIEDLRLSIF